MRRRQTSTEYFPGESQRGKQTSSGAAERMGRSQQEIAYNWLWGVLRSIRVHSPDSHWLLTKIAAVTSACRTEHELDWSNAVLSLCLSCNASISNNRITLFDSFPIHQPPKEEASQLSLASCLSMSASCIFHVDTLLWNTHSVSLPCATYLTIYIYFSQ